MKKSRLRLQKIEETEKIRGFARDNSNELHFKHVLLCAKYALHFEPTSCFQLSVYFQLKTFYLFRDFAIINRGQSQFSLLMFFCCI